MGLLYGWWRKHESQSETNTDLPKLNTTDHKLRVEAKMDYDRCVGEIEEKIAQEFARIFNTPVSPKYLGTDKFFMMYATYTKFSTGDLTWRMYSYTGIEDEQYHSFEVQVGDVWHNVDRPADLWIALGYGDEL